MELVSNMTDQFWFSQNGHTAGLLVVASISILLYYTVRTSEILVYRTEPWYAGKKLVSPRKNIRFAKSSDRAVLEKIRFVKKSMRVLYQLRCMWL